MLKGVLFPCMKGLGRVARFRADQVRLDNGEHHIRRQDAKDVAHEQRIRSEAEDPTGTPGIFPDTFSTSYSFV